MIAIADGRSQAPPIRLFRLDCVMQREAITWARARRIFGDAGPPRQVTQHQFDGFDDVLARLAKTPQQEIDFGDLWYYHHDLAYQQLQPDLFAYMMPVCLMDWHLSLQANGAASHGDSELHYGLAKGKILERMVSPEQRERIFDFFRDSFLERIDQERGFDCRGESARAHGWLMRFNSLGLIVPDIERIWAPWWTLEAPGQAVSILEYCSGLLYFEGENPLFGGWTPKHGGGGPYLAENDSQILDGGWLTANILFLAETLTPQYVERKVREAVRLLEGEPEHEEALAIEQGLETQLPVVELTVEQLLQDLEGRKYLQLHEDGEA